MARNDWNLLEGPGLRTAAYAKKGGGVLSVTGEGLSADGWLTRDIAKELRGRLYEFIRDQTEETKKTVQGFVTPRHRLGRRGYRRGDPGPGFTRAHIEGHYYDDTSAASGQGGSLYGKVRLEPKLVREPGGKAYGSDRRAYIAAAVLNSGRYGGRKVTKVVLRASGARQRRYWQSGPRRAGQKGLRFWYLAYRAQRPKFEAAANRVLRGLEG